jgi:hypothetical protein
MRPITFIVFSSILAMPMLASAEPSATTSMSSCPPLASYSQCHERQAGAAMLPIASQTVAMTYACPPLASYSDCQRGHPVVATMSSCPPLAPYSECRETRRVGGVSDSRVGSSR